VTPDDRKPLHQRPLLLQVIAAAVILSLVALVVVVVVSARLVDRSSAEVARRYELNTRIRQLQEVLVTLAEAEASQRGYLLTGRDDYLLPHQDAVAAMPQLLRALDGIPIADARLAQHAGRVRASVGAKLAELQQTIELQRAGRTEAALQAVLTDAGERQGREAKAELRAVMDLIRADRDAGGLALDRDTRANRTLMVGLVALLVVSIALASAQILLLRASQRRHARDLERSEQRHRTIVEEQFEFVSLARADGTLVYANPAWGRRLQRAPDEIVGRSLYELVDPADVAAVRRQIETAWRTGRPVESETRILLPDGSSRWFAWTNSVRTGEDGERLLYSVGRDIDERRRAEEAQRLAARELELQTATLSSVIESIPAIVAVLDRELRYRMVNRSWERWRGRSRDEAIGRTIAELFGQAEHDRSAPAAYRALAGETATYEKDYPGEGRLLTFTYMPLRLADGTVGGLIAEGHDITTQRDRERHLLMLSERDALTGLLNRAGFSRRLDGALDETGAAALALLYVDLDHFKPINDRHGHAAGDDLLCLVARRLEGLVRPSDAVARIGGDEFAIALFGVHERLHAEAIAAKVVKACAAPFTVGTQSIRIGACVGIAMGGADDGGWQDLARRADEALYAAKAAGRGSYA
jgi:diguanylate cyclase (GGDEF)-like protein/PAS domain S-box-containing protein